MIYADLFLLKIGESTERFVYQTSLKITKTASMSWDVEFSPTVDPTEPSVFTVAMFLPEIPGFHVGNPGFKILGRPEIYPLPNMAISEHILFLRDKFRRKSVCNIIDNGNGFWCGLPATGTSTIDSENGEMESVPACDKHRVTPFTIIG